MSADDTYSIAVIGAGGVGKKSLILRLLHGEFDKAYIPAEDHFEKRITVGCKSYNLKIIVTSGQDAMDGITNISIQYAKACIIVYSVASQITFSACEELREKVELFAPPGKALIVLCGNKCDIDTEERPVTKKMGQDLAKTWGVPFFETSAKEGINVDEIFEAALKSLLQSAQEKYEKDDGCNVA